MANIGIVKLTDNAWLDLDGADITHAGSDDTLSISTGTYILELKQGDRLDVYVGAANDVPDEYEYSSYKLGERASVTVGNSETILIKQNTNSTAIINISE
jgi:hypothetical protein